MSSSSRVQTSFRKSKRTYNPTTDEFNEAIEDYLHDHPKAANDQVRMALMKAHPTWAIPDRRLNKFVKRQKQGQPMTVEDDNTLSSKKPGRRIKGFFKALGGGGSSPKPPKETATKKHPKNPETAPFKKTEEIKEEPPAAVPAEPEAQPVAETAVDKSLVYVDDNDGSNGGPCAACEGCVVL